MKSNLIIGIIYVSLAIIIWGTIASLIDYPLLKANVYVEGSIGQWSTFVTSGFAFTVISVKTFSKFKNLISMEK